MNQLFLRDLQRRVGLLEYRYFPEPKIFTYFTSEDENGEVWEMFGPGFLWNRARDGGSPPEITPEFIESVLSDDQ